MQPLARPCQQMALQVAYFAWLTMKKPRPKRRFTHILQTATALFSYPLLLTLTAVLAQWTLPFSQSHITGMDMARIETIIPRSQEKFGRQSSSELRGLHRLVIHQRLACWLLRFTETLLTSASFMARAVYKRRCGLTIRRLLMSNG